MLKLQIEDRRCYRPPVIQLHRLIPDALAEVLRKAPLNPDKVAFAWRAAVGPAVDRATTILLSGSVLRVTVKEAAWRREVERSATLIRARMDALLGAGVIRSIDVVVEAEPTQNR